MASKRHVRRKACRGKVRHRKLVPALMAAKVMGRVHGKMRAYPCKFCGGFHIGHF